jgi:hypothetical protein
MRVQLGRYILQVCKLPPAPPGKTQEPPPSHLSSALKELKDENKITILLAAYTKHNGALAAIEQSQQSLLNLVLGIYSAALTLVVGLYEQAPNLLRATDHFVSALGFTLILVAAFVALYTIYMSHGRNVARTKVRQAVERIDSALGLFEPGWYVQHNTLYPESFREYTQHTFLKNTPLIAYLPACAFILVVIILCNA